MSEACQFCCTYPCRCAEYLVGERELDAWERSDGEYLNRADERRLMATVRSLRSTLPDDARTALILQMRERAAFANTTASLSRLIETWADVLEGKGSTGWAAMNRQDLAEEAERVTKF